MVVYWLDFQLFAGSNIALGLFVVVLGVALVAVIGLFLRRSPPARCRALGPIAPPGRTAAVVSIQEDGGQVLIGVVAPDGVVGLTP
jgi:hypothetical protein